MTVAKVVELVGGSVDVVRAVVEAGLRAGPITEVSAAQAESVGAPE